MERANNMGTQVIERRVQEPQAIFDELCEKRKALTSRIKLRNEALEQIEKYKKLGKDMATTRLQRKGVAADFDEKNPTIKSRIASSKDEVEAIESKLMGLSLEHFKSTGTMLEVKKTMRDGAIKKIRLGFSFRQLSLF